MKQKRISLEILRIIALCLVIYNHTGENGFELFRSSYGTGLWYAVIFLDTVSKAGVPLFFMISGALLLGKDESIKDIFLHRIIRYAVIIVLFSFIYYIHLYIRNPEYGFSIKYFICYIYSTPFILPYWFLYRYVSFLIILPVLRAATKSLRENEYLLVLIVTIILWFSVVWEQILKLEPIAIGTGIETNFILYPLLGYGIANVFTEKLYSSRVRIAVLALFVVNYFCAIYMNSVEYIANGELSGKNIDRFGGIPALTLFYFVIYLFEKKKIVPSDFIIEVISRISGSTFCIYLFEDMLRSDIFLSLFNCVSGTYGRLLMCIPYTLCVIASGMLISAIFKHVPVIKLLKI